MYNEIYKENTDVQITAVQMISAAVIFIVFFIVPAGYIERQRANVSDGPVPYTAAALAERQVNSAEADVSAADTSGQVAGATDTNTGLFRLPFTSIYIDFNSNAGLLTIAGIALFGIGLSLVGYVLLGDDGSKKQVALSEFETNSLERWN